MTFNRRAGVYILLASAVIFSTLFGVQSMSKRRPLRVVYPVRALLQDGSLVDPKNTDSLWHYYLLENLAAGLVRDDVSEPSGYRPVLARSWARSAPNEWRFELDPMARWSDGTPITAKQVQTHFETLARSNSRHIQHLQFLSGISVDDRILVFQFKRPTDEGLLHELSLADSILVHPDVRDWRVTSGPYFVSDFDAAMGRLVLRRNSFSTLGGDQSLDEVILEAFAAGEGPQDLFSRVHPDFYLTPPTPFVAAQKRAIEAAPQQLLGAETAIYFLYFDRENPLVGSLRARREFATLVDRGLKSLEWTGLKRETQMIPAGYPGRLPLFSVEHVPVNELRGQKIVVDMFKPLDEIGAAFDAIAAEGKKEGVEIEFRYRLPTEPSPKEPFARFLIFYGNQKDSLGSWSYLYTPEKGQLVRFRSLVASDLAAAGAAVSSAERDSLLLRIHRSTLENVAALPLMLGAPRILATSDLDLSRLNPFDLRPRFYELRRR